MFVKIHKILVYTYIYIYRGERESNMYKQCMEI